MSLWQWVRFVFGLDYRRPPEPPTPETRHPVRDEPTNPRHDLNPPPT